jgi:hypothetical protein
MSIMSVRPRQLSNQKFKGLHTIAPAGYFQYFKPGKAPEFLRRDEPQDICFMVVATNWNAGMIEGVQPLGTTFCIFRYRPDMHREGEPHFNKDVEFRFKGQGGNPFSLTVSRKAKDHYFNAVATGTNLKYLEQAYNLPKKESGTIEELIEGNTSIDPYPT